MNKKTSAYLKSIAEELEGAASMLSSGDSFDPEILGAALADLAAEIRRKANE